MKLEFEWIEDTGTTICYLTEKNNTFIGTAYCSDKDQDMKSRLTGETIAHYRANIARLKDKISKLSIEYKTLINFQKSIKDCKYYDENH